MMVAIQSNDIRRTRSRPGVTARRPWLALPVVLYLITILLPFSFWVGPLNITGVRAILIVLFIPMMVKLLAGKYGPVLVTDILFLLHMIWATMALLANNPDQAVQNAGATGIEFIGGYLLGRAYIRTAEDFTALLRALVVASLLLLPVALFEVPTGRAVVLDMIGKIPFLGGVADVETSPRLGMHRVQAVFAHPIHFGLFCTIAFSLCFVGLKNVYSTPVRWIASLVIGFCALLSLSSGALLAVAMQMFLIAWAWAFRGTDRRWLILLSLMIMVYVVIDLLSNRTPFQVFLSYATFSPETAFFRAAIFEWGMFNVWANPVFGIGLNDWIRLPWMYTPSIDNFWLLIAMRYGIPAFILLLVGYVIGLWKVGRLPLPTDTAIWRLRRAWVLCFCGLTFTLCTVHIWHNIYSFVFFMFGAGMWLRDAAQIAPQEDDETSDQTPGPEREAARYTRFPNGVQQKQN